MRALKTAIQQLPPAPTEIAEELGECKNQGKKGNRTALIAELHMKGIIFPYTEC